MDVDIFWFRRDLRLDDNAALYYALREGRAIVPIFIFDANILNKLEDKQDGRVSFIFNALKRIQERLIAIGSSLEVFYGDPLEIFSRLLASYNVKKIFANHDYEPYAIERDRRISEWAKDNGIMFHTCKDHVIFEKDELMKDNGRPYTVFTPYSRRWKSTLSEGHLKQYPTENYLYNLYKQPEVLIPSLRSIGFTETGNCISIPDLPDELLLGYKERRDYPGLAATSQMSVHLRFGTVSVRWVVARALAYSGIFLNELIWRDFYQMVLWHFPEIGQGRSFKPEYDRIEWRLDDGEFEKWCTGQTGYPIVDAGMRQLNTTGFMHNRVRMITASFLARHLLLDWRLGEAYFARKLLDFDLAANNGGWQWASGSGCDAVPYFRIFNPYLQAQKFDKDYIYIKKWVPEYGTPEYPSPVVEHTFARKRCLDLYTAALRKHQGEE